MTIKTNDLKKGDMCYLRNGWKAEIYDNKKGNTRLAKVYGFETEIGSVYSHDIVRVLRNGVMVPIEHTPTQLKLMKTVRGMGM
jgi:nitrogen fixation protein